MLQTFESSMRFHATCGDGLDHNSCDFLFKYAFASDIFLAHCSKHFEYRVMNYEHNYFTFLVTQEGHIVRLIFFVNILL